MSDMEAVLRVGAEGSVGWLTLHRPERLNALDVATLRALVDAADWFDARPEVKVVVVSGSGRAFCAGFDLVSMPTVDPPREVGSDIRTDAPGSPAEVIDLGRAAADALAGMSAVTVAAVHGPCVGGGLVLVLACDLRLASADATFSLPEVALGIPLAWGGVRRLVREVGPAVARDLILTGRTVSAEEAHRLGLVGRVVDPGTVLEQARAQATQVAGLSRVVVDATLDQVDRAAAALLPAADPEDDVALTLTALADPESAAVRAATLAAWSAARSNREGG